MQSDNKTIFNALRRNPLVLFVLFLLAIVAIFIQWRQLPFSFTSYFLTKEKTPKAVVILMWTTWFGNKVEEGFLSDCPRQNCILTNNRSLLNQSRAVVFHIRDHNWNDIPLERYFDQRYVFFNWESPYHTGGDFGDSWKKSYFNLSMTYRNDSDVYAPYGRVIKRKTPLRLDLEKLARTKTKPVAWMASNCNTPGRREVLVKLLQEYIPVDVFGSCGNNTCRKDINDTTTDSLSCGQIFEENYKFYLAFENSLCQDYVTEKFFLRLRRYIVPVVLERENYQNYFPEYKKPWFIAANDFKSVQELGSYLQYLHQNLTAYYEYLSWHRTYEMEVYLNSDTQLVTHNHWCNLCRVAALNFVKTIPDIFDWWHGEACHPRRYCNVSRNDCV